VVGDGGIGKEDMFTFGQTSEESHRGDRRSSAIDHFFTTSDDWTNGKVHYDGIQAIYKS